jgi:hypothetical protein
MLGILVAQLYLTHSFGYFTDGTGRPVSSPLVGARQSGRVAWHNLDEALDDKVSQAPAC